MGVMLPTIGRFRGGARVPRDVGGEVSDDVEDVVKSSDAI